MINNCAKFLLFSFLLIGPAMSQSLEGLKDIVSVQQEKILRIEDNLKKLIGSIEQQSNFVNNDKTIKLIENHINDFNNKIKLLENNIKNITNLSYDLDFALKRIERHLDLTSIQNNTNYKSSNSKSETKPSYQKEKNRKY
jgi:hypothetical protein